MPGPSPQVTGPRDARPDEHAFEFSGGELCLDFANTVSDRPEPNPREHLHGYGDLVAWGRQAGVLAAEDADRLSRAGARRPEDAERVHGEALRFREALYRIFSRLATDEAVEQEDLEALNGVLASSLGHTRVVRDGAGLRWGWSNEPGALDRMLWPVARSALDLLTSERRGSVGECDGDDCGWLFIDESRNQSRRWCSMETCGNRAKARRHYARTRRLD